MDQSAGALRYRQFHRQNGLYRDPHPDAQTRLYFDGHSVYGHIIASANNYALQLSAFLKEGFDCSFHMIILVLETRILHLKMKLLLEREAAFVKIRSYSVTLSFSLLLGPDPTYYISTNKYWCFKCGIWLSTGNSRQPSPFCIRPLRSAPPMSPLDDPV